MIVIHGDFDDEACQLLQKTMREVESSDSANLFDLALAADLTQLTGVSEIQIESAAGIIFCFWSDIDKLLEGVHQITDNFDQNPFPVSTEQISFSNCLGYVTTEYCPSEYIPTTSYRTVANARQSAKKANTIYNRCVVVDAPPTQNIIQIDSPFEANCDTFPTRQFTNPSGDLSSGYAARFTWYIVDIRKWMLVSQSTTVTNLFALRSQSIFIDTKEICLIPRCPSMPTPDPLGTNTPMLFRNHLRSLIQSPEAHHDFAELTLFLQTRGIHVTFERKKVGSHVRLLRVDRATCVDFWNAQISDCLLCQKQPADFQVARPNQTFFRPIISEYDNANDVCSICFHQFVGMENRSKFRIVAQQTYTAQQKLVFDSCDDRIFDTDEIERVFDLVGPFLEFLNTHRDHIQDHAEGFSITMGSDVLFAPAPEFVTEPFHFLETPELLDWRRKKCIFNLTLHTNHVTK
jgi:hypothetical protein